MVDLRAERRVVNSYPPPAVVCLPINDASLRDVRAEPTNCASGASAGILDVLASNPEGAMARGKRNDVQRLREEKLMSKAELARRAGVPYTITPSNGAKQIYEGLNQHRYDIGFLAYEAERAREVDFSGPYLLMGVSYLVPADSPIKMAADADRASVKIGAVEANSPTIYLQRI